MTHNLIESAVFPVVDYGAIVDVSFVEPHFSIAGFATELCAKQSEVRMDEFLAGKLAFVLGLGVEANPYDPATLEFRDWQTGWNDEKNTAIRPAAELGSGSALQNSVRDAPAVG